MEILYGTMAQLVLLLHFAVVLFNVFGPGLALPFPKLRKWHLICLGATLGFMASPWYCPLTYLEQDLLELAGKTSYEGSFIARRVQPLVYWQITRTGLAVSATSWFFLWSFVYWRLGRRRSTLNS